MATYEGWSNYPTWAVNLWLANDESLYLEAIARVRAIRGDIDSTGDGWLTRYAADVANMLESMVDDSDASDIRKNGLLSDVLTWALGQVDWRELALAWIDTADSYQD